ncbi:MAG: 30S ribosomal protein S1 [Candidatus Latescibacterota bacterium]|nr:MAG: 30S ribosomal protein S1 [Candidatus Latescibacterota bacterium]
MNFDFDDPDTGAMTRDDFLKAVEEYDETLRDFGEGEIVKGTVVGVNEKEILVDIGFKSEGAIPAAEFDSIAEIEVGQEFDVYLEKMENQDGLIVLSKTRADFLKVWDRIKAAYDSLETVFGTVDRRIKGGLVAKLYGVDAFLPGSQVALRQVPNLDALIGQELEFRIIKLNKRRRNIVVSRRVVLEEERAQLKAKIIDELEKGQVRKGVVKNITDFGAFVDLGGIDGLLHLTDLSWGRVSHPSEVVQIGETLEIKVLDFDRERERISLGLKQLQPYPWKEVEEKYPVGNRVKGKVVSIADYGAFVELERGVEGLIHISEMSWTKHVRHPSKIIAVGDDVEVMVLKIDPENEKISLGLKQTEPDPWETLAEKYPPATELEGKVRNLTNFGAFVEIEEGIDGLVHISDMSWTKRVRHPSEVVKKGDVVRVKVLEVNRDSRRISLGIKQTTEDPWDDLAQEYVVGTALDGTVERLLDRGIVVELRQGVEGFVPVSHLLPDDIRKPAEYFGVGDQIPLKVIKMDPANRRIVLSVRAYMDDAKAEDLAAFNAKFGTKKPLSEQDASSEDAEEAGVVDEEIPEVAPEEH